MRLNPDCIRDILLYLEDKIDAENDCVSFNELVDNLGKYNRNMLYYHVNQISKHDFVDDVMYASNEPLFISDLTPKGHEFLANIRSNTKWNKVKGISEKIGSTSLDAIIQISSNVITDLITQQS